MMGHAGRRRGFGHGPNMTLPHPYHVVWYRYKYYTESLAWTTGTGGMTRVSVWNAIGISFRSAVGIALCWPVAAVTFSGTVWMSSQMSGKALQDHI
jgi:hypothetical protein